MKHISNVIGNSKLNYRRLIKGAQLLIVIDSLLCRIFAMQITLYEQTKHLSLLLKFYPYVYEDENQ